MWLWGQATTDPWFKDTWTQPQVNLPRKQLRSAVQLKRCQEPTGDKEPENLGHNENLEQWEKTEHPTI